jgi:glycogen(starch) synthase
MAPYQTISQAPYLFEVAWEVCQQVGGIYTVLKTKVPAMLEAWGDRYCLIGPYNPHTASIEFEETSADEPIRTALRELKQLGIPCFFGRWLIPGKPKVLLLDFRQRQIRLDDDKYLLWKDHGITTTQGDSEVNDAIAFGFTVAEFFIALNKIGSGAPVLAHFHEWLAGVGAMRIAHLQLPIATVFTTHATLLGRYMASDDPHFYEHLDGIDPGHAAERYAISPRYLIERIAAHAATVFTTISECTAREAERFLGRKPEFILPNGLNVQRFTALHEFQNLHLKYKERIHEFVMGHFFPSYSFNLDKTIYLFTSGRYEYRNKGMDLFIESLYRLNNRLKELPNPPTVVAFIITRSAYKNANVSAVQSHLMLDELKGLCNDLQARVGQRMLSALVSGRVPQLDDLLPHDSQIQMKRAMYAFKRQGLPSIVTHDLTNDGTDAVLSHLRHRDLINRPNDPVKVVFHPEFMTATSPLLGLDYDQFVRGCHMGVFPSYYEPWGYTPLECIALGIPTVTSDLSGFGGYIQKNLNEAQQQGVYVLPRRQVPPDFSIEQLTNHLVQFCQLTRRERIELRNKTERLTDQFDWSVLAGHYHDSHRAALMRKGIAAE